MKKYSFCIMAAIVLIISSCGKPATASGGNHGSWTFNSVTYTAATTNVSAGAAGNSFYGFTGTGYTTGEATLSLQFYGSVTQGVLVPGTYVIAHQVPPDTGQVYIVINTGGTNGTTYGTLGGYGPETLTLSTVNGKYNLSGSGIKLTSLSNDADSNNTLSLNVTQQ
jgi:hypothetical protein